MKYAIIKIINGNYFIHAEDITDLNAAKSSFHGLCQSLWNAPDVITGCVAIIDENMHVVSDTEINPLSPGSYIENITHPVQQTEE